MYHKADKEFGQNYAEFIWHGYITKPNTCQTHIPNLIVNINNYLLYLQLDLDNMNYPLSAIFREKKKLLHGLICILPYEHITYNCGLNMLCNCVYSLYLLYAQITSISNLLKLNLPALC